VTGLWRREPLPSGSRGRTPDGVRERSPPSPEAEKPVVQFHTKEGPKVKDDFMPR